MRVLHVIPYLDPAGGGPPAVATRLAAAQAGLGHDVSLFLYRDEAARPRIAALLDTLPHRERIRLIEAGPAGRMERMTGRLAARELERVAGSFDFFHLHGVWETALVAAGRVARRSGVPYAVAPHGMLNPWSLGQKTLKKRVAMALGYRAMLNGAAFLHVLTADERDPMKPLGLLPHMVVLPNGVFLEEIEPLPPRGQFRRLHPELGEAPYIVYLSRLAPRKGLDHLADAFAIVHAEHRTARLVIIGPDGGERAPLEKRIGSLGIGGRTHILGPVYGRDKFAALEDATVFCLPSEHEGFSMAITEALACGLPVVISPECHFPDVEVHKAGLTVPTRPLDIAKALLTVLNDPSAASAMGAAARSMILSKYTWPKIAATCIAAYESHAIGSRT
jgi:glycosyltransferase involved in cell wall biosynthesis